MSLSVSQDQEAPSGPFSFSAPESDLQGWIAHEDGRMVLGSSQDCEPYLERAKYLHNTGQHGSSDFKHAASFPAVIVEKYCNDRGIDFRTFMAEPAHIKRMLNDPDLAGFRIWKGRV